MLKTLRDPRNFGLLVLAASALMLCSFGQVAAQQPSYLVIRPEPQKKPDHTYRDHNRGYVYGVHRQPYAYGWFGASSYRKPALTHGYYGRFYQWSFR